jgi:hypothetical protein
MITDDTLIMTVSQVHFIAGFRVKVRANTSDLIITNVRHLSSVECRNSSRLLEPTDGASGLFELTFHCSVQTLSIVSMMQSNFVIVHFNRPVDCEVRAAVTCIINTKLFKVSDQCELPDIPLFGHVQVMVESILFRRGRQVNSNVTFDSTLSSTALFTETTGNTTKSAMDIAASYATTFDSSPSTNASAPSNTNFTSSTSSSIGESSSSAVQSTAIPSETTSPMESSSMKSSSVLPDPSSIPSTSASQTSSPPSTSLETISTTDIDTRPALPIYASYSCQDGFSDSVTSRRIVRDHCGPHFDWSYVTLPDCIPEQVCLLPTVAHDVRVRFNLSYSSTHFLPKHELYFDCKGVGQRNLGASSNFCADNGSWIGGRPHCDPPISWWSILMHSRGATIAISTFSLILSAVILIGVLCALRLRRSMYRNQNHYELRNNFTYEASDPQFRFESDTIARRTLPRLPASIVELHETHRLDEQMYLELEPTYSEPIARTPFASISRKNRQSRRKRLSDVHYLEEGPATNNRFLADAFKPVSYTNDMFDSN